MMNVLQACGVVAKCKGDSLLVATMLSMFVFDAIEGASGPLSAPTGNQSGVTYPKATRINSVPLMGGAGGLGLGLALAQPQRKVIVMDGDASLLMELGTLATIASQAPKNLIHCVVHNGTQFTAFDNMALPTNAFRFAEIAREAGYAHAERIDDPGVWATRFPELMAMDGPIFVELIVAPPPKQTGDGFVHPVIPLNQFDRMGKEATEMKAWLGGGQ